MPRHGTPLRGHSHAICSRPRTSPVVRPRPRADAGVLDKRRGRAWFIPLVLVPPIISKNYPHPNICSRGRGGGRHPRKPLTRHAPSTTHLHCLFTRPKIDPSFASSEFSGLLQQFSSAHPGLGSGRESREEVTGSSSRPRTPCETPLRPCSRAAKYSSTWPRDLARCDSLENPRVIPEEMTRLPLS